MRRHTNTLALHERNGFPHQFRYGCQKLRDTQPIYGLLSTMVPYPLESEPRPRPRSGQSRLCISPAPPCPALRQDPEMPRNAATRHLRAPHLAAAGSHSPPNASILPRTALVLPQIALSLRQKPREQPRNTPELRQNTPSSRQTLPGLRQVGDVQPLPRGDSRQIHPGLRQNRVRLPQTSGILPRKFARPPLRHDLLRQNEAFRGKGSGQNLRAAVDGSPA